MARGRVKRQAVQSDDGWTVITHGLSGLSLDNSRRRHQGTQAPADMPDSVDGLTAATLLSDFKARQERWKTTDCSKQVRNLMEKRGCPVEEAVCIGIGSFSRDWEHRHRSLWQLVLFVHVVEQREDSLALVGERCDTDLKYSAYAMPRDQALRPRTRFHSHRYLLPRPARFRSPGGRH